MSTIKKIKSDFIKVIQYSQGIEDPKVDKLFELWLNNKRDIIEVLGGKYIYEVPETFSFELSEEEKKNRIDSFIDWCWDLDLRDLADFIEAEREGFFSNTCNKDYEIVNCDSKKKITKGTKLVKSFKYFINDTRLLNDTQSQASQIIQENKVEGKLCFSVHPLDFLSISETTHSWRSCHALDGEYRAGNLSYMMDNSTIICYLKSEKDAQLPHFPDDVPWNSKKWRVLLYLSNDWKMIFAGKQYPFSTQNGMQAIINKIFNKNLNMSKWSDWTETMFKDFKLNNHLFDFVDAYIPLGGGLIPLNDLVKDKEGSKHFNDVLRSSCYEPIYTYMTSEGWREKERYVSTNRYATRFKIGEYTYCLRCGEVEVMDNGSGTMMCYECEKDYGTTSNDTFGFCARCNDRIVIDTSFWISDDYYCSNCFHNNAETCLNCEDAYFIDDMVYDENEEAYYCRWCYKETH